MHIFRTVSKCTEEIPTKLVVQTVGCGHSAGEVFYKIFFRFETIDVNVGSFN